jgi:hypothetical protein
MRKGFSIFGFIVTIAIILQFAYSTWLAYSFISDLQKVMSGMSKGGGSYQPPSGNKTGPYLPSNFSMAPYCSMTVDNALNQQEIQNILTANGYSAQTVRTMIPMGCGAGSLSKTLSQLLQDCTTAASALGGMGLSCP